MDFSPIIPQTEGKQSLILPIARFNPLLKAVTANARWRETGLAHLSLASQPLSRYAWCTKQIHQFVGYVFAWQRHLRRIANNLGYKNASS
ncbi:hypothetical protein GE543_19545 [Pseudomonas sp. SZ57]|uniref:Uncharacterized protein n=1 Tax=Pseudomonas syringae UB303 TaxID=1357287 RepID=A0AAJ4B5Q7_PSESX|nr:MULTISPECIES: hypothetical protein [Pseudomonas]MCH5557172.1 hypothetical protein [Pseudomonas syringae pv. syringae]MCH5577515.1 hypothetical protein [Pseudomonas syringae pv. syringae]MCH5669593.1 hypothetical protein [Pseudomonas syringae pv. syringae]MQQ36460.1 hypothetical protein [Pseudomonas sp. SZ57]QHF10722.1 hypothetical protein N026_26125 [Pseudomonas syringae UB303]